MSPIADKLLIVAALSALVSLGRPEAWVAMVIIARELAVTVLRVAVGSHDGSRLLLRSAAAPEWRLVARGLS
jgi:phosphatidylglycerophosphate synthase